MRTSKLRIVVRWATFDCYGTLIDWNGGIRAELARVFGDDRAAEQLERYHLLEPELETDGGRSYREVMTEAMRALGAPPGAEHGLAESLPSWRAFSEVRGSLEELRSRGWRLGVLSNTDDDFIAASQVQIGVAFDEVVVAQELGSYKPAHRHWEEFFARTRAPREGHVHVGGVALPRHRPVQRARSSKRLGQSRGGGRGRCRADARARRPVRASGDAR